ncbi:MAG: hypothetical protein Q8T08_03445, partial [Ignavibacteria bacterium]|nr:hypothetical protein [Ignavibacteria bacterium]
TNADDIINQLVKHYKTNTSVELYHAVATEKIEMTELKKQLLSWAAEAKSINKHEESVVNEVKASPKPERKDDFLLIDENLSHVNYKLSKCCNPIPGDAVFGFVTISNGISIHRTTCPNAARLKERYDYRVLEVRWKESKENPTFHSAIRVVGKDTLGLVGDITKLISSDLKVNMRSIAFDTSDGQFIGKIVLQIKDTDHLEQLMYKIGKVIGVERVTRLD